MGDYDRKPMEPPSQWLKLKGKGDEVRFRIAGRPLRELAAWPAVQGGKPLDRKFTSQLSPGQWMTLMRDPNWNINEVFHFIVIDRSDEAAKVFTTTGGVYGKIRDYATNPEWGNPMGYDITVKRTEAPGRNYYEVTPSPNKTDLMKSDLDKADALDTATMLPGARPASEPQPDDFPAGLKPEALPHIMQDTSGMAAQPAAAAATAPQAATGTEASDESNKAFDNMLGDEPININEIPF